MKQKSCIKRLMEGDSKTSYFHKMVKAKHFKEQIKLLQRVDGVKLVTQDEISKEVIQFFNNLLGTKYSFWNKSSVEEQKSLLNYHPEQHVVDMLANPVTAADIFAVIKNFPPNKASRPDGTSCSGILYKWEASLSY